MRDTPSRIKCVNAVKRNVCNAGTAITIWVNI